MTMPCVLNFRTDGLPYGAVYIGRASPRHRLSGSKWGNPFKVGRDGDRAEVIDLYRQLICDTPKLAEDASARAGARP
jgi:hypothetical protein